MYIFNFVCKHKMPNMHREQHSFGPLKTFFYCNNTFSEIIPHPWWDSVPRPSDYVLGALNAGLPGWDISQLMISDVGFDDTDIFFWKATIRNANDVRATGPNTVCRGIVPCKKNRKFLRWKIRWVFTKGPLLHLYPLELSKYLGCWCSRRNID